jgi:hypothetical protein
MLWCGEPGAISNAIEYAQFRSRSQDAAIVSNPDRSPFTIHR